jgi:hypothetical protein
VVFEAERGNRLFLPLYSAWFAQTPHPSQRDAGDVRNQTEAWETYDSFLQDERVSFRIEADPEPVESALRKLTSNNRSLPQQWGMHISPLLLAQPD